MQYELGPFPWCLATSGGLLRKTNKSSLAISLEKLISGILRYADLSNSLFSSIMNEASDSNRVDVVFDIYKERLIKNPEREEKRGATEATQFKDILPGHKMQQWRKFVKGSHNKASLIKFLCNEWKEEYRQNLKGKTLFLAYDQECLKVDETTVNKVQELECYHEEADTGLLLHAHHASTHNSSEVLIVFEDTDVLVLAIAFCNQICVPIYQKK